MFVLNFEELVSGLERFIFRNLSYEGINEGKILFFISGSKHFAWGL